MLRVFFLFCFFRTAVASRCRATSWGRISRGPKREVSAFGRVPKGLSGPLPKQFSLWNIGGETRARGPSVIPFQRDRRVRPACGRRRSPNGVPQRRPRTSRRVSVQERRARKTPPKEPLKKTSTEKKKQQRGGRKKQNKKETKTKRDAGDRKI